jgi:hypothetical protein
MDFLPEARAWLSDAPTIGGWISCSERLPDDMTYVLTTIHIPGREPVVRSGVYENGLFHNDNGDVWKATDREVLAWLPLPEPWKGADGKERVDDIHIKFSAADRSLSARTRNRNNNSDGHIVFSEVTERSE